MSGKRVVGRPIKKGEVLNPKGRPPIPEKYKHIRKLYALDVQMFIFKYLNMPVEELEKLNGRKDIPMIELFIISMIQKGIKEGDTMAWKTLMDYTIGMLPRPMVIKKIEDNKPRDVIPIQMTKEEKLIMLDRLRDKINAQSESSSENIIESTKGENESTTNRETASEVSETDGD